MKHSSHYINIICELGLKNHALMKQCTRLGLEDGVPELKTIDQCLWQLLYYYKSNAFDFIDVVASGTTLLVGEGNLSFSISLIRKQRVDPRLITCATYESLSELSDIAINNARKLKSAGVTVKHGVDATQLSQSFGSQKFRTIVFQFPHAGSREPIRGRNPNFILLRDFLGSACNHLYPDGQILVTTVDNPHYRGAFQFDEAVKNAGFTSPQHYPFDPNDFPDYTHTMKHDAGSALSQHNTFSTWVFKR
ncbi:MAG: DUF2431 domain-containing protein [Sphaerospermopsis sp. SIO1G2]|nr:DUF2431 domain-containing protein [Sphaerospermopsis sp. SIO1G2]